jgi:hypothetical protein
MYWASHHPYMTVVYKDGVSNVDTKTFYCKSEEIWAKLGPVYWTSMLNSPDAKNKAQSLPQTVHN